MSKYFSHPLKQTWLYQKIYLKTAYYRDKLLYKVDPKLSANLIFKKAFGRNINWDNPQNIIEKNIWMQFNTDTSLWTRCADKFLVREYVKECGCENLLNTLYGKWDSPDEIDYDMLPNQFVLKTNNACGTVIVVRDKSKLDKKATNKQLGKWLKTPFGYNCGQMHYLRIKPCIIAEEYLGDNLRDYKLFCFNGIPDSCLVTSDRNLNKHTYYADIFSIPEWRHMDNMSYQEYVGDIPKPKSLHMMIDACKKLASNIPFVRMDFYDVDGSARIGEMTFTMGFGSLKDEFYNHLGSKLHL